MSIQIHKRRPAELAGGSLGLGGVILGGAEGNYLAAVLALIGLVPGAVTYLRTHGGLRGVARGLVSGDQAGQSLVEVALFLLIVIIALAVAEHAGLF